MWRYCCNLLVNQLQTASFSCTTNFPTSHRAMLVFSKEHETSSLKNVNESKALY